MEQTSLKYYRVPEEWTAEEKLEFLRTHSLYSRTPQQEAARAEEYRRRLMTKRPHPVRLPSKDVRAAAADYQRAYTLYFAMTRGNPGHVSLPALLTRLDAAREALFASLAHRDRHNRRAFLVKWGM